MTGPLTRAEREAREETRALVELERLGSLHGGYLRGGPPNVEPDAVVRLARAGRIAFWTRATVEYGRNGMEWYACPVGGPAPVGDDWQRHYAGSES